MMLSKRNKCMKKYLNCSFAILTGMLLLLNSACSGGGSYQKSIYTDDTKISAEGDSYSFKNRVGNTDKNSLSLNISGFYGKQTVWEISAKEDSTVTLVVQDRIDSGRFKLCLIDAKKSVTTITEGSKTDTIMAAVTKGKNYITMVGSNAKGKIKISLSSGNNVSIKQLE